MTIKRKTFEKSDYNRVRMFLKDTYTLQSSNWTIERWAFSQYFNCPWLEVEDTWYKSIGLWVDDYNEIMAIVCTEGETDGDIFFQLRDIEYSEAIINEMIGYAEDHLYGSEDGKKYVYPRLNNTYKAKFKKVLEARGYTPTNRSETDAIIHIDQTFDVELPEGFTIEKAINFKSVKRALAHGQAFSVEERIELLMDARTRAFSGVIHSPDYKEDLDLCVVDEDGNIAAFAIFWVDDKNNIAALEPLGTVVNHQKKGLGKALVYEGLNRLNKLGIKKLHVGSDQEFYKKIDFEEALVTEIWKKEF